MFRGWSENRSVFGREILDEDIKLNRELALSGRYDGSHTTFLHLAVSPSEETPIAFPLSSKTTYNPKVHWNEFIHMDF